MLLVPDNPCGLAADTLFAPGLTILEAFYGSTERDENGKELMVDVTIPLQALVHHSQLHIPGHRSKVGTRC